jgi:hypothetical protein
MVAASTFVGAITWSEVNDVDSTLLKCLVPSPQVEPMTGNKNSHKNILVMK